MLKGAMTRDSRKTEKNKKKKLLSGNVLQDRKQEKKEFSFM
jgi:hypothetical protein